jgi:4-aminobutyrate aminotransferase-like enzyme
MGSEKSVWDRSRPALQRGLLPVGCGFGSSRPLPPLNATRQEIDVALQIPEDVLNEVIS